MNTATEWREAERSIVSLGDPSNNSPLLKKKKTPQALQPFSIYALSMEKVKKFFP